MTEDDTENEAETPETQPLLHGNKTTAEDTTSTCRLPIDPIPTFFLLAIGILSPLLKEFLYYKQCENSNITFVWNDNSSKCFLNMSDPGYLAQQKAQAGASQQLLYHNMGLYMAACFSAVFFWVWSDLSRRRKVAIVPPIFGGILQATFKIGILLAAMYFGYHIISAVGIRLLGRIMDDLWIAQIGILSDVLANILMAVSAFLPHRDIIPFIVPCVRMFARMQHCVISSGMSKLVPQDRQGSVFALLYCFEAINKLTESLVFLPVYRATLHWFPGFVFLINPAINFIITVPVLGFVHYRTRSRSTRRELTIN
ncbi:hypothetical protein Bbelb_206060 [Branchiostoma belcheri]|nr:hypothetical protein Bbelb_206060 [Branchiostoma belcheri]